MIDVKKLLEEGNVTPGEIDALIKQKRRESDLLSIALQTVVKEHQMLNKELPEDAMQLLSMLRVAHMDGNKDLEKSCADKILEKYGMQISFPVEWAIDQAAKTTALKDQEEAKKGRKNVR